MNKTIFLATPISGFPDNEGYLLYRAKVLKLISTLRENSINVYSEIEKIIETDSYDSPAQSVIDDFQKIIEADLFLMLHPLRLQTSTLIELGYAYALHKRIIIVGAKKTLPFLALGFPEVSNNATIIESLDINDSIAQAIINIVKEID